MHQERRLYRLIAAEIPENRAAEIVARFIERHGIETLNVAGPSAHKAPMGHDYASEIIREVLRV